MRRQSKLYSRWSTEMRKAGTFRAGERLGVAVSGGPDSILLLDFMGQFAAEVGLCISVVHFNHRLRGDESTRDESFVSSVAANLKVEFIRAEADVARVARLSRRNLEATARELRYRFFYSLVRQGRLDKIATAHTANDQAETVLLRLLRGAGTRGLGGIHPVLDGVIVRPFLGVTRREVEDVIRSRQLEFRTDSSNLDLRFLRNRIRQKLLPLLEAEFNPAMVLHLKQLADHMRGDEDLLDQQARELARPWRRREGREERIPLRALGGLPRALQVRVLRQMAASAFGQRPALSSGQFESLLRFIVTGGSGKRLLLAGGLEVRRDFDWITFELSHSEASAEPYSYSVPMPGVLAVPALGVKFRFEVAENPKTKVKDKAYNNGSVVKLDMGKMQGSLILRNWRAGDRFQPQGRRRSCKLKELFQDMKIPAARRKIWPVIEDGKEIVWVRGFPSTPAAGVTSTTLQFLTIIEEPLQLPRSGISETV
ncbi:MAG TPA: tRNA lysidine(34) synthetase TilS [Terriglobia bacterium]|nr:tRNA lysidine(34) synthetase TilS [Terriglobia bacterium]